MDVRKRKRGIRASRAKLEAAMLAAGFETQADLAQYIAEQEQLDKPPRDLVNKIFREQPVSTHNLARIAKALNVDAYAIYLSQQDTPLHNNVNPTFEDQSASAVTVKSVNRRQILFSLSALFVAALIFWVWQGVIKAEVYADIPDSNTRLITPLGKVMLILQAEQQLTSLAKELAEQLNATTHINAKLTTVPKSAQLPPNQALNHWQVHAILQLELQHAEHYQLVTARISSATHKRTLFQTVLRSTELAARRHAIQNLLSEQTERFIAGEALLPVLSHSEHAVQQYLQGKDILFTSLATADFNRAKQFFINAVQSDNTFAAAYAELCRLSVRSSWIEQETALLEQAATYCEQATQLNPDSAAVLTARAELLSRTGNSKQAITLLHTAISEQENDADALAIGAAIYLTLFGQDNQDSDGLQAEHYANKALALAPDHWHALNTLGNLHFMTGQTLLAKQQFAAASKVVKHELILANLGTLQLCHGELEQASQTYSDLIASFENNYLGYENLGTVYHFQQAYPQALKYKLAAIEKQPDIAIHQVWGSLAELYLQSGQHQAAIEYYSKAISLIERDELLENISVSDQLHNLYYQTKLHRLLHSTPLPDTVHSDIEAFVTAQAELGLKAKSHLAWLLGETGRQAEKQQLWQQISQVCVVYQNAPELLTQTQYRHQ